MATSDLNNDELKAELVEVRDKLKNSHSINVSSVQMATFLTEDYLDLSSFKSGKFRLIEQIFCLQATIKEVIGIVELKA